VEYGGLCQKALGKLSTSKWSAGLSFGEAETQYDEGQKLIAKINNKEMGHPA
jgi:hypothetical protein